MVAVSVGNNTLVMEKTGMYYSQIYLLSLESMEHHYLVIPDCQVDAIVSHAIQLLEPDLW
jgi:hypothetical protein